MQTVQTLIVTSKLVADSRQLLELVRSVPQSSRDLALLFVCDGVYSLVRGSASLSALQSLGSSVRLYACRSDIESRGIKQDVADEATLVDYDEMVGLMMKGCSKVVSYF